MKKKYFLIIPVIFIPLLILALVGNNPTNLISIYSEELETMLQSDSGIQFVYIGRPTCAYCKVFEPILEEAIEESDATVYYYNTDEVRNKGEDDMLVELLGDLEVESVPILLKLKDGAEVSRINEIVTKEELVEFLELK